MGFGFTKSFVISLFSIAAVFVQASESIDVLEARHYPNGDRIVAVPGVLEPKAAHEYRLNYDDSTGHSTILSLHLEHFEKGVELLKGLKVIIDEGQKTERVALALRLVADLTQSKPQLKLAVQLISGGSGSMIVPVEQCELASERFPSPPQYGELPDWTEVRVLYPWSGFQGKLQKTWANGWLFLHSAGHASRSNLIPMLDVVYEEWDADGQGRNQRKKVLQNDGMEAYSISRLSRVKIALSEADQEKGPWIVATPKGIVIDLYGDSAEVKIAFEINLHGKLEERILPVSAIKGFGDNDCASLLTQ